MHKTMETGITNPAQRIAVSDNVSEHPDRAGERVIRLCVRCVLAVNLFCGKVWLIV